MTNRLCIRCTLFAGVAREIALALADQLANQHPRPSHLEAVSVLLAYKDALAADMRGRGYSEGQIDMIRRDMGDWFNDRWIELNLAAVRQRDQQPDDTLDAEPA
jgi:hypothetical protein